jgi:hypothetical protein
VVTTKSKSDSVTYTLTNDLRRDFSLSVNLGLDLFSDTFIGNLDADITNAGAEMVVDVSGGSGADTIRINTTNNIDGFRVGSGAELDVIFTGGEGNDQLGFSASGSIAGASTSGLKVIPPGEVHVSMDGGNNFDSISTSWTGYVGGILGVGLRGGTAEDSGISFTFSGELDGSIALALSDSQGVERSMSVRATLLPGSTGSFGTLDAPATVLAGGSGDAVTFVVNDQSSGNAQVNAFTDGGTEFDRLTHTPNVFFENYESVTTEAPPAFRQRSITSPTKLGQPTVISGVITDPDKGDTFRLRVDWGDGSPIERYQFLPGTFVSGKTRISVKHVYAKPGNYKIFLLWRDDIGLFNTANMFTTVLAVLPKAVAARGISALQAAGLAAGLRQDSESLATTAAQKSGDL